MAELERKIREIRTRLILFLFLNLLVRTLLVGLVLALGYLVAFRLIEIPWHPFAVAAGLVGASVLVAGVWTYIRRVTPYQAAMAADENLGLRERLSSALMLKDYRDDLGAAEALQHDALKFARAIQPRKDFKIKLPRLAMHLLWPTAAFVAVYLFMPQFNLLAKDAPEDGPLANDPAATEQMVKQEAREVRELAKKAREVEEDLKAVDDAKFAADLERLSDEMLMGTKDRKAAIATLSRLEDQVKMEKRQLDQKADPFKQIEGLQRAQKTREIQQDLKDQQFEDAAAKMEAMANEQLSKMNSQETQQLASEMQQLAEELKDNKEMSQQLQKAAEALNQLAQAKQQQEQAQPQQQQQQQNQQQSQQQQNQQQDQQQQGGEQGEQQQQQSGQEQGQGQQQAQQQQQGEQQQGGQQQQQAQQQQSQQGQGQQGQQQQQQSQAAQQAMQQAQQAMQQAAQQMQNQQQLANEMQQLDQLAQQLAQKRQEMLNGQGQKGQQSQSQGNASQGSSGSEGGQQGQKQDGNSQANSQSGGQPCAACNGAGCAACNGTGKALGQGQGKSDWKAGENASQGGGSGGPGRGRGEVDDAGLVPVQFIDDMVRGEKNEGEILAVIEIDAPAEKGESNVRYTQIYNTRAQKAADSMRQNEIPLGYRNAVRDYFEAINPQKRAEQ